jgi:hypothetical protein
MAKIPTYIVSIGILFAVCLSARAQETPEVKASVNKNEILIGEPLRLSIDVKSPMVSGNQLPQFDSIPHFELMEKANRDSLITASGTSYHLEWKLTSFDSGTQYIPSFSVIIGKQIYKTDSLPIEVSYGKVDSAQDYHDIKNIIDIENPNVKYIPWILGALTLIGLGLFIYYIRQPFETDPQNKTAETVTSRISPVDEAMASLDQLKLMLRDDPSTVKKYYSGMNDTLRIFLNRQLGLITMEKTSEEMIHSLSDLKMDRDIFSNTSAALRMGDFVKFAKYVPGPYENESNLEVIRNAILAVNVNEKRY